MPTYDNLQKEIKDILETSEVKKLDSKVYENIIDKIKEIETPDNDFNYKEGVDLEIIEKQKVYLWIRLFLEDSDSNVNKILEDIVKDNNHVEEKLEKTDKIEKPIDLIPNDDLLMEYKWAPGEKIMTKFACYGKKGVQRDHEGEIVEYNPEDDKRVICLLADSDVINYSEDIPFLRRLFKGSFHYQEEIVKRQDLTFTNQRTNEIVRYFDIDI